MSDTPSRDIQDKRYASLFNMFSDANAFTHPTELILKSVPLFFQETKNVWEYYTLLHNHFVMNVELNTAYALTVGSNRETSVPGVFQPGTDGFSPGLEKWMKDLGFKENQLFYYQHSIPAPIATHLLKMVSKQTDIDIRLTLKGNVIQSALNLIPPVLSPVSQEEEDSFI